MNTITPTRSHFVSAVTVNGNALVAVSRCTTPGNRGDAETVASFYTPGGFAEIDEFLNAIGFPREADWEPALDDGAIAWVENRNEQQPCDEHQWCDGHNRMFPPEDGLHMGGDTALIEHGASIFLYRWKEQDGPERFELRFDGLSAMTPQTTVDDLPALAEKFEAAAQIIRQYRLEVQ